MGLFKRTVPSHLVPVHRHNAAKDWVILLEAGTIVGPSPERRVRARYAGATDYQEVTFAARPARFPMWTATTRASMRSTLPATLPLRSDKKSSRAGRGEIGN
jgi:hypothetical protein